MNKIKLKINTILHTKDGRKIGNSIITNKIGDYWEITTDYGNRLRLSDSEIDNLFYIAWENYTKEKDGASFEEMQELVSNTHKYRVRGS